MRKEKKRIKKEKGITLVVLASVTISATFGDNGIIKKAELARDLATNSTIKENEDMNSLMDEYTNIMSGDGEVPEPPKDETPPTVSIQVGEVTETSIAITVNATDDSGEIASYKYYLNGVEQKTDTVNTYTFDGLTAGTEYTIKVESFDKANNKGEKTITVSTTKKPEIGAGEINKEPSVYYGSEVRGYTCTSQGVSKWRIFYADSTNIYLIADDYISYQYAPKGKNGTAVTKNSDYRLSFNNVYSDYPGASWIKENSKGSKWLNKLLSEYSSSTNKNVKAVGYMMDTNVWSIYSGSDAEFAMGGPTLDMFCESYKDTHPGGYIMCQAPNAIGYQVKWSYGSWDGYVNDLAKDEFNKIYIKSDKSKAYAMWLASPSAYDANCVMFADYTGLVSYDYSNSGSPGFCPLVCLKSGVQLNKVSDGVYEIVK